MNQSLSCLSLETVASIDMQSIVGHYDTPDTVPEWAWVEAHAPFVHRGNGTEPGIYEYILVLSVDFGEIPPRLAPIIAEARSRGAGYLTIFQS